MEQINLTITGENVLVIATRPDGKSIVFAGSDEPEPEPVISVLPQGVGVWKVDSRPEFLAWLREHYDWNQNWSGAYSDKGLPYIYEVKSTRLQDIQQLDNWLSGHVQNENFRGINLNCESG